MHVTCDELFYSKFYIVSLFSVVLDRVMGERERIDGDGGNQPKLYLTCNGITGLEKLIKILGSHRASLNTCQLFPIGLD